MIHDDQAQVVGGKQIKVRLKTSKEWCDYYGVDVKKGIVILYKGVNDDYSTQKGVFYTPGSIPKAPDWDGGKAECGGGLHFSPCVSGTLQFRTDAHRFIACPVCIKDFKPFENAQYPDKIKAPGCCAPVWEVDRNGEKVQPQ